MNTPRTVPTFLTLSIIAWIQAAPSLLVAAPVDRTEAGQVAANWLGSQTGLTYQVLPDAGGRSARSVSAEASRFYHVINMQPEGWVIVSADDVAHPIIGYSTEGAVEANDRPPAFTGWMRGVDASIGAALGGSGASRLAAGTDEQTAAARIADTWLALRALATSTSSGSVEARAQAVGQVAPLIRTTWSQEDYYNALCPLDARGPDGRALVGCCATAMGQILRYHAQPAVGTGSYAYTHSLYGTLSADFGATRYNWAEMPSSGVLNARNTAVATLLSHMGIAVDMNYGPGWSECFPSRVAPALRTYFNYQADDIAYRWGYSDEAWTAKITQDLDAGRPIFYVGYGGPGHAFVLDGYRSDDYFHFNWGWNGAYDGYFLISNLNPGGSVFTNYQAAVFGIRPLSVPPGGATLRSPRGTITTATPTFVWNRVSGATHYQLWVADSTSGNQGKIATWYNAEEAGCATGETCSVNATIALADGAASWRIQTRNDAGEGPWSAAMRFTVETGNPPNAARLISPSGSIGDSTPTYRWAAVGNATWYQLWVDDVTSGGNGKIVTWYTAEAVGCPSGGGNCKITPDTALVNGEATWWIQTWNDNGEGPWSAPKTFVVDAQPPPAATLLRPATRTTTATPDYEWTAVADASWYYLWVDDPSSGGDGKITTWYTATEVGCGAGRGRCRIRPTIALQDGAATWWIQTWNENGEGPWSEPMDFTVNTAR
jgi:hypothetical protein